MENIHYIFFIMLIKYLGYKTFFVPQKNSKHSFSIWTIQLWQTILARQKGAAMEWHIEIDVISLVAVKAFEKRQEERKWRETRTDGYSLKKNSQSERRQTHSTHKQQHTYSFFSSSSSCVRSFAHFSKAESSLHYTTHTEKGQPRRELEIKKLRCTLLSG